MFKGLGNLASLLRQAQQFSGKMQAVNDRLKGQRVSASTGGGMIDVEANGLGEVLRVKIDATLVERGEREMIEDLLPGAINQALAKAKQCHFEAMKSITDGLNIAGLDEAIAQISNPEDDSEQK
ncbi:MAG: YbaB/EbfC family nucleoid-associated protein [Pirellulaceae bacterium]|nr:YbaB/EbfC family nucleoid-associated protein [Pirellulaceae bacterium]